MPNPLPSDVHVNTPLTQISIAYMQNAAGFVADKVFPNIPVQKQSDVYFTYSRADYNRDTMRARAPSTESAGDGWRIDNTNSYYCTVKALHKDIDDQLRSNADSPINLDRDATTFLSSKAMINREVSWASVYFTTGVWKGINNTAQDITGTAASPSSNYSVLQWNDSSATPVTDVKENNDKIHLTTGFRGNKLVLGRQVWTPLSDHGTITDRVKYTSSPTAPAIITKQAVAALMEIDEIMVMDAIKNTGAESNSTTLNTNESNAFIGGKAALLVYAAPAPSVLQPSGGYTFSWNGYLAAGAQGQRITTFRMQQLKSDRVEIETAYAQKLIGAELGIYFDQIVA